MKTWVKRKGSLSHGGKRTITSKTGLTEPKTTQVSKTLKKRLCLNFLTATHSRWH